MTKFSTIEQDAINYVASLLNNNKDGHGVDHAIRVLNNAKIIAEDYNCDLEVVTLAALLHDVDDHKLFNTVNNANARKFLVDKGYASNTIDFVCKIINEISFRHNTSKPSTIEGQIVQDADRLDAIGAIGIARAFVFTGSHSGDINDGIQHFKDKLLELKDLMNTKVASILAESRHQIMLDFLAQFEIEKGGT